MNRWIRSFALLSAVVLITGMSAAAAEPPGAGAPAPDDARSGVSALGRIEPRHGVLRVAGPPRAAVVIEKLLVEEGDRVERGQELAVLQGIALQRADVARFQAELAQAEREVRRRQGLARASAGAESELEEASLRRDVARAELARAEAELELSHVRAPIAGQVLEIHARAGERVGLDGILELGDTSAMYAIAEVYESEIGGVRVGQRAQLRSPALPRALSGTVERVGLKVDKNDVLETDPVSDADARVVEVEILLDDPGPAAALTNLRVDVLLER
jgi:multidrug efflux pump subunit AcrA (membrane-fusion protein)